MHHVQDTGVEKVSDRDVLLAAIIAALEFLNTNCLRVDVFEVERVNGVIDRILRQLTPASRDFV